MIAMKSNAVGEDEGILLFKPGKKSAFPIEIFLPMWYTVPV